MGQVKYWKELEREYRELISICWDPPKGGCRTGHKDSPMRIHELRFWDEHRCKSYMKVCEVEGGISLEVLYAAKIEERKRLKEQIDGLIDRLAVVEDDLWKMVDELQIEWDDKGSGDE